jgi:drug/metabolite transporter (DMT)-like permease
MAFNPAMTAGLSALVDRRAIGIVQLTGLLLGLTGVVVVVSHGQWSVLAGLAFANGDLLLIASGAAWSIYSVVLQRRVTGLSVLQVTTSTIAIFAVTMWLAVAIVMPATLQWPPPQTWLALLFMGVVGSGLAYVWWNGAVVKVGAARASMFMNLVPVFTMLMGLPLGESLAASQLVGAALVIIGVWLATRSS